MIFLCKSLHLHLHWALNVWSIPSPSWDRDVSQREAWATSDTFRQFGTRFLPTKIPGIHDDHPFCFRVFPWVKQTNHEKPQLRLAETQTRRAGWKTQAPHRRISRDLPPKIFQYENLTTNNLFFQGFITDFCCCFFLRRIAAGSR